MTDRATTAIAFHINAGLPVVLEDGPSRERYLYGARLSAMKQSGNWYYYLADGLGSAMAVVDASGDVENGYTYDVYGEPTATGSLANEFDFAGQQTDGSTGLQYLRARYYDPETGVFLSRDPLATSPAWIANSFSYAGLNPTSRSDPTGLCKWGLPCFDDVWRSLNDLGSAAKGFATGSVSAVRDFGTSLTDAVTSLRGALAGSLSSLSDTVRAKLEAALNEAERIGHLVSEYARDIAAGCQEDPGLCAIVAHDVLLAGALVAFGAGIIGLGCSAGLVLCPGAVVGGAAAISAAGLLLYGEVDHLRELGRARRRGAAPAH